MRKLKFLVKAMVLIALNLSISFAIAQPSPSSMPIVGDSVLCIGEEYSFSTYEYVGVEVVEWVVPFGIVIFDGYNSSNIIVYVDSMFVGGYISVRGWDRITHYSDFSEMYLEAIELSIAPDPIVSQLQKNPIEVYPNPTSDYLYVDNLSENVDVTIFDMSGKILSSGLVNERIDFVDFPAGLYLIRLIDKKGRIVVRKIQKQ